MKINTLKVLSVAVLVASLVSEAQGTGDEKLTGTPHQTNMQSVSDKDSGSANLTLARPINFYGFQSYLAQYVFSPLQTTRDFLSYAWNNPKTVASDVAPFVMLFITIASIKAPFDTYMWKYTTPETHPYLWLHRYEYRPGG